MAELLVTLDPITDKDHLEDITAVIIAAIKGTTMDVIESRPKLLVDDKFKEIVFKMCMTAVAISE